MTHAEAIQVIDHLYPPDAGHADTAAIGRQLLLSAWALEWRSLPDKILIELAKLNEERRRIEEEEVESTLDRYRERYPG